MKYETTHWGKASRSCKLLRAQGVVVLRTVLQDRIAALNGRSVQYVLRQVSSTVRMLHTQISRLFTRQSETSLGQHLRKMSFPLRYLLKLPFWCPSAICWQHHTVSNT